MTDDTANLVIEYLKRFQSQLSRVEDRMDAMQSDMRSMKKHMAAFMGSEANQDTEIAGLKVQLERIERRLELRD